MQRRFWDRIELEAAVRHQRDALPQVGNEPGQVDRNHTHSVGLLGLGQEEQIIDETRHPRDLRLHQRLDPAYLGLGEVAMRGQDLELTSHDRQGPCGARGRRPQ